MNQLPHEHRYRREDCITFCKTHESFGAFSNMADGYPLQVNGVVIRYAEALYQACRFPHAPELQREIITQASPMAAKMIAKKYTRQTREDWDTVKIAVMRWVVNLKCHQHQTRLRTLFLKTGQCPIVEESRRDRFWGATPCPDGETMFGCNLLGLLLMEAREAVDNYCEVSPSFPYAILLGLPISVTKVIDQVVDIKPVPVQLALSF